MYRKPVLVEIGDVSEITKGDFSWASKETFGMWRLWVG